MQTQAYPRLFVIFGGIVLGAVFGFGAGYGVWAQRTRDSEAKSQNLQVLLRQTQASLADAINPFQETGETETNPVDQVYANPLSGLKVNPFAR